MLQFATAFLAISANVVMTQPNQEYIAPGARVSSNYRDMTIRRLRTHEIGTVPEERMPIHELEIEDLITIIASKVVPELSHSESMSLLSAEAARSRSFKDMAADELDVDGALDLLKAVQSKPETTDMTPTFGVWEESNFDSATVEKLFDSKKNDENESHIKTIVEAYKKFRKEK
ncbi:RxLR-like protein [Plasmopara halstedii]|uniref:Secreted RxLR effector protein RXLR-C12 n=1 Tax=Plasmopara halstedii TaxID=4781 RepID=RLR12_PLAHL|nr:RxLR-like protein [Plasmopara halstedii]A0A0P1AZU2.1 RecName: Full=Secreted RxLR effector protein RXLR-C12; Flags: Precursor [Plasmopara halstedii]CEG47148.1 RxLR-like protein [Plasmopara halstedii]|eukprot:XP_024583517.1 RxLR-like protein [Plasmopara halstedii]